MTQATLPLGANADTMPSYPREVPVRLSRAATYALYAGAHLAALPEGGRASVREVHRACGIPEQHLAKVMKDVARAGLFDSLRGPTGGFRLARPPSEITLLALVEAIEGATDPIEPEGAPPAVLEAARRVGDAQRAMRAILAATTLADVASRVG